MKTVDYDDEENWVRSHDDEDDDDDEEYETPVDLHSGKFQIKIGKPPAAKLLGARQRITERNSGSIKGKSNQVIVSIAHVCFNVINQNNKLL